MRRERSGIFSCNGENFCWVEKKTKRAREERNLRRRWNIRRWPHSTISRSEWLGKRLLTDTLAFLYKIAIHTTTRCEANRESCTLQNEWHNCVTIHYSQLLGDFFKGELITAIENRSLIYLTANFRWLYMNKELKRRRRWWPGWKKLRLDMKMRLRIREGLRIH